MLDTTENAKDSNRSTKLITFERRHIRPIPLNERHGTTRGLFFVWLGINMLPLTVVTGALGPTLFGLSLGWTITAVVIGNVIGGFGAALHAAQGPQLGIPQMLQARGQFGYFGGSILALIALIMFLGFFASNLVVAAQSFSAAFQSDSINPGIIICAVIALGVAIFGYDLVRKLMGVFSIVVGVLVAISIFVAASNPSTFAGHSDLGFSGAGFFGMLAIGVTWQLAYAPYVSDYSRYMPREGGAKQAFWATYLGLVIGTVLVMVLGALVGLTTTDGDAMAALGGLLGGFGPVVLFAFGIASAVMNSSNIYSGVMCSLTVFETLSSKIRVDTVKRVVMTVIYALLAMLGALLGKDDFLVIFGNFVTILLYVLIPWSAINLVDYFILRKGHYAVDDMFRRDGGIYGRWDRIGLVSYLVGILVQIPFMVTTMYTGPLAEPLAFVDVAWMVGFVVPAIVYGLWKRSAIAKVLMP
ncbi:NCS1 nucleoside transporter family [Arthrobacter sp. V4I6]|uniref:purine-cytosine permease family protein n=1 Tax=unclassified Arthrobacter TaxID=235627 RepID=UPI00277E75CC|nr:MULTISPECIES: cytosine permease [unclassified Arthrobacter]MDQ0822441.1 NCS1 nucleoside transporter family [Arthrobacter sp. V1I7]MDQ0852067.1 NCS1 nucleoside transporter family [Arthrobacter sp. V4I6]